MPNIIRRGVNSQGTHYTAYSDGSYWYSNAVPYGYSATSVDDGYGSDGTYDGWHRLTKRLCTSKSALFRATQKSKSYSWWIFTDFNVYKPKNA